MTTWVPITTNIVSSNIVHGEVNSIQRYPVLDTKMNGWGLGDAPQNLFSIVFIDVQLIQKDNRCNISYITYYQWRKKT